MSEKTHDDALTTPETSPLSTPRTSQSRYKVILFILSIGLCALLAAVIYNYYDSLTTKNIFTSKLSRWQQQGDMSAGQLRNLEVQMAAMQQSVQRTEALAQKQQQVINDWEAAKHGDLNKWTLAEVRYLVRLAQDQLTYVHDPVAALILLQRAEQVFADAPGADLNIVRDALAKNITALQALPQIDTDSIFQQLAAADLALDSLLFPSQPLTPQNELTATTAANTSWWSDLLEQATRSLKKLVIVRYDAASAPIPLMPEQKALVLQSLHAEMQNAIWGVLHQNNNVYKMSLTRVQQGITQYFAPEAPETIKLQTTLHVLQQINLPASLPSLAATLELFNQYFVPTTSVP